MTPLVLIPHVSWRRMALIDLLEQLAKQTMPVDAYVLHDTYERGQGAGMKLATSTHPIVRLSMDRPAWWPATLAGGIGGSSAEHAQCARWQIIEYLGKKDHAAPILTLDDDMIIDEKYVEWTVGLLHSLRQWFPPDCVLSWGGVNQDYRWNHYYDEHPACELVVPQAGAMAFYARTFVGLNETLLAEISLVRGGSEEIPVAAFLHDKRIPIFRPSGRGPTPHKCAFDARSSYRTTQGKLGEILKWAEAHTTWPHAKSMQILLSGCRPAPYRRRT